MAHNLNIEKGKASLMLADKPAWHKLGTVVDGTQTWDETIKLANLNWTVTKSPLYSNTGRELPVWGIFRDDNNEFLGSVGANYTPIQNKYSFNFIDALLETENGAHYDSAGALGKGERIFVSAKIPYQFKLAGTDDTHLTYLLFTTSHDGSLAAQCKLTDVRVVCNNTLQQSLKLNGTFTRIKHTQQAEVKLELAKKMLSNAETGVLTLKDKLEHLSLKIMTKESYTSILDKLFPPDKDGNSNTRRDNTLREITELFTSNDNNAIPEIKGTAYNLLNAVTQYTDHNRTVRQTADGKTMYNVEQARAESAIFGTGVQFKANALDIIIAETQKLAERKPQIYSVPASTSPLLDTIIAASI